MGYLIRNDYKGLIQVDSLTAIIGNDSSLLTEAENTGVAEVISYLVQKYDTAAEFTDTALYSPNVERKAKDRVYLDATAYSATSTYTEGALCLQGGKVFEALIDITEPQAFDQQNWQLLGNQYAIYYALTPEQDYNYYTSYLKDDKVFYKNKVYTAVLDNSGAFPDKNPLLWGSGVAYTVSSHAQLTNEEIYTKGDNRNPQIKMYLIDVVLYHIHSRIAPRNIPDLRVKRYDDSLKWLKSVAHQEEITANIPRKQPEQGQRILWGSRLVKQRTDF